MHLILTGATGLVGGAVLDAMLAMPEITRISILTRRPVPQLEDRIRQKDPVAADTERVRVILHKDFGAYDDALLAGPLRGAAGVVWALGISQLLVSKEDYATITKTYSLAAAEAFSRIPSDTSPKEPFRFVWVSGEGATTSPGLLTQRFGRVKGETEVALAGMTNAPTPDGARKFEAMSVRPAAVDVHGHTALAPYAPTPPFVHKLMADFLVPALRVLAPSTISPTAALGPFLAQLAMGRYESQMKSNSAQLGIETYGAAFKILPNSAFRKLYGLDK